MIVPVSANHSGPYNFLLDTGTQVTMIDPSLVAELQLEPAGGAVVAATESRQSAAFATINPELAKRLGGEAQCPAAHPR